jgi:DNA invertase Pin-like site-specific DNA recombinase
LPRQLAQIVAVFRTSWKAALFFSKGTKMSVLALDGLDVGHATGIPGAGATAARKDGAELTAAGCAKVFKEKASGARSDRPELAKAINRLEPGDVLVVTRLDRLARSTRDLLNVLDEIGKRGAGFRSLRDTWADTTMPHGRLMLTVLGGLAEFERELIRARTGEGRKRAQERGVRFGRPQKLTPHQRQEVLARIAAGESQADICSAAQRQPAHHQPSGCCQPFRARRGRRPRVKR